MLEKKEVVQKSLRIDSKLDEALNELASILNRSQNELIEHAIRKLIVENQVWFADDFVKEYYDKIHSLYTAFEENILSFKLVFIPYDFTTRSGGKLVLKNSENGNDYEIVQEFDIGNNPGSPTCLKKGLAEIIRIMIKKHPELKEKYRIKEIDV